MASIELKNDIITLPDAPGIQGLSFRRFRGESDYLNIYAIILSCKEVDGLEHTNTVEEVALTYTHLHNCDPTQDMLFAEINGEAVGYTRGWWDTNSDGEWLGFSVGWVKPDWRGLSLGSTLLGFIEQRLRQIAATQIEAGQFPASMPHFFTNDASEKEKAKTDFLEQAGYVPVRYAFSMVRPNLEDIPAAPLPPGLEVRPVLPEHYRLIWDASNEAFRDHWSYIPAPEEEFQRDQEDPHRDPSLWRVAWDGDQVAGMVLGFINAAENAEYNRKRGYTENICVRRPWRRHGLARALIVQSLYAIKERGMTEAALGVDTQNTSGALHLYESVGFRPVSRHNIYNKPMEQK